VNGFLVDTNVLSEMTRIRPAPYVERWLQETDNEKLFVSVLSIAEILKGITRLPMSKRRSQLQEWLDNTLHPWFENRILPVTQPVAERLGRLAGERDARGLALSASDGLIAATALEHDLALVTRNVKDFGASALLSSTLGNSVNRQR
jgi:predicted nucleic acid-binding protein